jgi:4,5-DOPA dioxygenase extradiol
MPHHIKRLIRTLLMTNFMPVFFFGHGSPMNAIEDNEFSRAWVHAAEKIPPPEAILCISAHWETSGIAVTAMQQPRTIHDFNGFPRELSEYQYPAPGSPILVNQVYHLLKDHGVQNDLSWGLDHSAWAVLCRLYTLADVPVVQLSLDRTLDAAGHYELRRLLAGLRAQGILIIGSGNIVHNLRLMVWQAAPFDWAEEYDNKVKGWIWNKRIEG